MIARASVKTLSGGRIRILVALVFALGCVSSASSTRDWPAGNDARQRATNSVQFGPSGRVRFSTRAPAYVVFLELRPTLDSLDLRFPVGVDSLDPLSGSIELVVPVETVDRMPPLTASAPAIDCTLIKNAGDDIGREFCPVSRSYARESARSWYFRNRVFLLVSDRPLLKPLPQAIRWADRRTMPPVTVGSGWTVLIL